MTTAPRARRWTLVWALATLLVADAVAQCGERRSLHPRADSILDYALAGPPPDQATATLLLLAGGPGVLALAPDGCIKQLAGNFLLRSLPLMHGHGFATAVVDAVTDHAGPEGLAGHRVSDAHAREIGMVIADLRRRGARSIWLLGHSRGAISAANAAGRLDGGMAADGLVLTSPVTAGGTGRHPPWVAQTVDDVPPAPHALPILIVNHGEDRCPRSPLIGAERLVAKLAGPRRQLLVVRGGPEHPAAGIDACVGRSPHGFLGGEATVVRAIAAFILGERLPEKLIFPGQP